jgi:hypothetical protein
MLDDPSLGKYLDSALTPPVPFVGTGPVRLIILGQDPTVKAPGSRAEVRTVLNLDRPGALRRYLQGLCEKLGLDLEKHIFATNYVNAFFRDPPASIKDPDLLRLASAFWRPVLQEQLDPFPDVPLLALGQPLLRQLVHPGAPGDVRTYWGYDPAWKRGDQGPFTHLDPPLNHLGRHIFPFPHQPSSNKAFYTSRRPKYIAYMKESAFTPPA